MNYLAHAWVLPEGAPPGVVLGCALPDMLSAVDRRAPRLTADAAGRLEAAGERDLARGVRAHQAADASFHALPAFQEGRRLAPALEGVRGFFLGHILLEMLLDAALAGRTPGLTAGFYAALEAVDLERTVRACSRATGAPTDPTRFLEAAGRFLTMRFLFDYATDDGILLRLGQVLGRARQPLGEDGASRLRASLPDLRDRVDRLVPALTDEPRAAVARALA
jgi:hypothetical protein